MKLPLATALLLMPGLAVLDDRSPSADYALITATSNPEVAVKRREVARIFLKQLTRWKDGSTITPIDQSAQSEVRAAFTKDVMRSEGLGQLSAIIAYWHQQIYAGTGVPPEVKNSDAEVLAYVAANRGAVGYVRARASLAGVKTLKVVE
jgi:ABC-type phosphate transport system substrate-binding protein